MKQNDTRAIAIVEFGGQLQSKALIYNIIAEVG